jgi:hypothetical protein
MTLMLFDNVLLYFQNLSPVIRFSRDDMLRLWRPTKILPTMTELAEMISITSLEPMSLQPLGQDEVRTK